MYPIYIYNKVIINKIVFQIFLGNYHALYGALYQEYRKIYFSIKSEDKTSIFHTFFVTCNYNWEIYYYLVITTLNLLCESLLFIFIIYIPFLIVDTSI